MPNTNNIASLLAAIQTARNTIRTKLVELGLATSTDKLAALASAVETIENRGAVSATVQEGDTYTIPKGYHSGAGTVSGVSGGGNYNLQGGKTITPTKAQQVVTPDSGYYGLSDVTVAAIPPNFQDISATTATEADVLTGKVFTDKDGAVTTGTMPNNGAVTKTLDVSAPSYTVPGGYHSGAGKVQIALETKTATPTKSAQDITPTAGKVLSRVTVEAIPAAYQDVSGVTATADKVLVGAAFVGADGQTVEGEMTNNGELALTIDGLTAASVTIPAGYASGGTVSLTSDIETALAAI